MAFDGIITKQVVLELQKTIIGGKINKVYEPNKNEVLFGIYSNGKNYTLCINISSNYYSLHLTNSSKPNPTIAPNFCMLLRKHLIGFKICNIHIEGLERVVTIDFEGYNELNDFVEKKLVVELMGKHSNIILINSDNRIIDSLRHLDISSNSYRDILPAHEYSYPNIDKKDFLNSSLDEFKEITTESYDNIYLTYNGFSKTFVYNCIHELNINEINDTSTKNLYNHILYILNNLGTFNVSCIQVEKDFAMSLVESKSELQTNQFLDNFYKIKEDSDLVNNYRNNLLKLILASLKRISSKISVINSKLKECENMDTFRIYGELITANLYRIDNAHNVDNIQIENYYDSNNLINIPLDKTISPSANAQKYFKKYNKLKNTLEIISNQRIEHTKELNYLESIVYELENTVSVEDIDEIYAEITENVIFKEHFNKKQANIKKNKVDKKRVHNEYEPITYNIDGFTLYVGKNNKQNDYITTKLGKNEDLWFHTKDIRGSHVLLKCNGKKVNNSVILACAEIAAFYSKAKLSSNVPVDYCYIKNVKKPSGSKPGMVIYTANKTLYVTPKNIAESK